VIRACDDDAAAGCRIVAAIEGAGGKDPGERRCRRDSGEQENQRVGELRIGPQLDTFVRPLRVLKARRAGAAAIALRSDRIGAASLL
jgi:hypothetical protein